MSSPRAQARPAPAACQRPQSLERLVAGLVDRRPQPRIVERAAADHDFLTFQIDLNALDTFDAADLLLDRGLAMGAMNAGDHVGHRLRHLDLRGWLVRHYTPH